ncbi:MAG: SusC/RagA family TonB-linked outer membrane protein, partial [Bacteroidales bacterium]|nr:SusC/RagA family TonB-linked outer membrane protein [Bacteroidales bacterium]
ITLAHSADALSALEGKVAGMQISSSGGTGTSQKVIVRGYSSIAGNNQPLYVIDGVPMSNSTMGVQDLNNSIDFGNQAADINPDDIETITVLKGASATALYGSRAANGVIIINTKRGAENEKVKITYDGTFSVSSALRIPNLQQKFGQGWYYSYEGNMFENQSPTENGSWGNILDGREVEWRPGAAWYDGADPSYTSYSYKKNSLDNFYCTGFEANNNISVEGGTKNSGYVFSYGNIYSDGILPGANDYFKRNTFSFRGNTKLWQEKAWVNYGINYVKKDIRNAMTGQGGDGSVIYNEILQYPVNIDYADLKDYNSVYNNNNNYYSPYQKNPWWVLDHNYGMHSDDHIYGNFEFGLNIIKGLQLIARGGLDINNYVEKTYNNIYTFDDGSYASDEGASPENGSYSETAGRSQQWDFNTFLNADYRIATDWSIHGVAGLNVNERASRYTAGSLSGLAVSQYPSFDNTSGATPTASSYMSKRRLAGLYTQADLGWKDAVYLTLSARNDWSSTLPKDSRSFFYWGANASVILTDLFPSIKNDVISFLKLRGGYGKTGNDAGVYLTSSYYYLADAGAAFGSLTFPLNSYVGLAQSSRQPATTLKPEISTETEFGVDARFFDNRLSFDLAWYNKLTKDQIISATLAPEAGYTSAVRNVGKIRNKGVELTIGINPVRTKDFSWDFAYTFSKNWNKVEELWDNTTETTIYGLSAGPQLKAIVGEPLGTWTDYPVKTVEDESSPYYGCVIVNATTGYPMYDNTKQEVIGKADADFMMGFTNKFRYKSFSLGFTFDWRKGGLMYSATHSIAAFTGNTESSTYNKRDARVEQNAVYVGSDGQYHENNIPVNGYYNMNGVHYSNYNYVKYRESLLSKSYLKLREVSLSYSLPKQLFTNISWLTGVDVSLVGRNLLMWTKSQGLIDPDMTNYGNDLESQYGEYYSSPSTRSIGCNIKIVF